MLELLRELNGSEYVDDLLTHLPESISTNLVFMLFHLDFLVLFELIVLSISLQQLLVVIFEYLLQV